jgi:hypothetical protein
MYKKAMKNERNTYKYNGTYNVVNKIHQKPTRHPMFTASLQLLTNYQITDARNTKKTEYIKRKYMKLCETTENKGTIKQRKQ